MSLALVSLPLSFSALGNETVNAPFLPVSRTVNVLQADEVLVRVSYSSVNPMDGKIVQSNFCQLPLPMVVGYDFAGTVVALGTEGVYKDEAEAITLAAQVMGSTFGMG